MRKLLFVPLILLFAACGNGDYSPKPKAYLRIDTPQAEYALCDTSVLPFTFERNKIAHLAVKRDNARETWVDIEYPDWQGVVFLTYKRLASADDLRGQTDTSQRLLESHYQFTSGIDERGYSNPSAHVYATTFHLKGRSVASTYQFWATDSLHHFLRGSLYLNQTPNNDSLAPILTYIQSDIDRLIESLRWRK